MLRLQHQAQLSYALRRYLAREQALPTHAVRVQPTVCASHMTSRHFAECARYGWVGHWVHIKINEVPEEPATILPVPSLQPA